MSGPSLVQGFLGMSCFRDFSFWPFVAAALGNGYFLVIATTILTLVLIGVCLLVKYVPNLINDIRNGTNSELPDLGLKLWVALILLLPVFFDAGPLWFLLWWFLVLWGYLNMFEKRIVFVFVSLIFMSSWLALVGAGFLTYAETNVSREIFAVERSIGAGKDRAAIEGWARTHPSDAEPLNAKALWEMDRGNYGEAVALLTRILDLDPDNSRYYNHLGIALAAMGKNGEAIKAFQNAATLDPDNLVHHFNLSRIYQATFNFYEADRSIQKASKIDPERVRHLLDHDEKYKGVKKYITQHVPIADQLARQMKPSQGLKGAADSLWHMAFGIFERGWAMYLSLGILLILFLLGHIPEEKFTKRCNRCGNQYYAGSTSLSGYPMCLQCLWIETKPKSKMNTILTSKAEDIKGFRVKNARQAWKLELILPGMGSFYVNKTAQAIFKLTVFSAAALLIVTGGSFIHSFVPSTTDYAAYARGAGVLIAGLLYWRTFKTPPLKYGV
ncbi:MAG TPA: tetratricopeptide repeat protein [Deltaproteobacteria bacterium]|nr:tetratricopeptide repeat protein [Deltaproteobacteria bacterium]HOI07288.1 tetratricopeptide repeat protein [Deltaproteobacteria bacterium]